MALSACWPVPGQNPDRTAHNDLETTLTPATVGGLHELWASTPVDGPLRDPVVAGGGVIASTGTHLHRFGTRTGHTDWSWFPDVGTPSPLRVGAPFVVDDQVLVGYGLGNVGGVWEGTRLDPATGAVTGSVPEVALVQGVRQPLAVSASFGFGSGTPILVSFGVADLASGAGTGGGLLAFAEMGDDPVADLTLGRERVYHSGQGLLPPAPGEPVRAGQGVRAFPSRGGSATCGPPEFPRFACPLWATEVGGTPTPAVLGPDEQVAYVGTSDGTVTALDAATGTLLWSAPVGAAVDHPPALAGGVLYAGTAAGDIVAVSAAGCGAATCAPLWTADTGAAAVANQPAVAGTGDDAIVYAGTAAGDLVAFAAAGCGQPVCPQALWSAGTGSAVTGGPIVSGGRVYAGLADGRMVAFAR